MKSIKRQLAVVLAIALLVSSVNVPGLSTAYARDGKVATNIELPLAPVTPSTGASIGMDQNQQIESYDTISELVSYITQPATAKPIKPAPETEADKETAATEQKMSDVVNKLGDVKVRVTAKAVDRNEVLTDAEKIETEIENYFDDSYAEVIQYANIDVTASGIDKDNRVTELGKLNSMGKKVPFTFLASNDADGGFFSVARVFNGQAEVLPATDYAYDESENKITFKADKFSTYALVKISEKKITGNQVIRYDGDQVTFGKGDVDFKYPAPGMPVWFQLNEEGVENGDLPSNYTVIPTAPSKIGSYAVTVYDQKKDQHSEPFYFEIEKAVVELKWPEKIAKIFDNDPYFDIELEYVGGLVGDDAKVENPKFTVRVTAANQHVGVKNVIDISSVSGPVDLENYQITGNPPTQVRIVPFVEMFPTIPVKPGDISKIQLPKVPVTPENGGDLGMIKSQQDAGDKAIRDNFVNILKPATEKPLQGANTASERETAKTEKNISDAVKRSSYINFYLDANTSANGTDSDKVAAVAKEMSEELDQKAEVLQYGNIGLSAKSIEQNGLIYELGQLNNLSQKLSFTMMLADEIKGGDFAVARIENGNVTILPATDVAYDEASNSVTFNTDKLGEFAIIKFSDHVITGNSKLTFDGEKVTLDKDNGDFNYAGKGMPVWYQLKNDGVENGELPSNYTLIKDEPMNVGKYAVTIYNEKTDKHSAPFYFEIEKAVVELKWPEKIAKIFDNDPYFDVELEYEGGLAGADAQVENPKFTVRVKAANKHVGIKNVVEIGEISGPVDLANYEIIGNPPTQVRIVPFVEMFPNIPVTPGEISTIELPKIPQAQKNSHDLGMVKTQQDDAERIIRELFKEIVNNDLSDSISPELSASEQETAKTERKIASEVAKNSYIKFIVKAELMDQKNDQTAEDKFAAAISTDDKIVQMANLKVSAQAAAQNGMIHELGQLKNLDQKLSFTILLAENNNGTEFKVARISDGQVEFLPATDVLFDEDRKAVTFKADQFSTYALIQTGEEIPATSLVPGIVKPETSDKPATTVPAEVVKPAVPSVPEKGANIGMDAESQAATDKALGDMIECILNNGDGNKPEPSTAAEKETAKTEKAIAEAAGNAEKIAIQVETEQARKGHVSEEIKEDVKKINDEMNSAFGVGGSKILQVADIDVTAKAVSEDGTERDLGYLRNLKNKIALTAQLPESAKGENFGVGRVHDGKTEILPDEDVKYDAKTKKITFMSDKFSTYAVFQIGDNTNDKPAQPILPEQPIEPEKPVVPEDQTPSEPSVPALPGKPAMVKNLKVKTDYGILKVTFDKAAEPVEGYKVAIRRENSAWRYFNVKNNSLVITKLYDKNLVKNGKYEIKVAAVASKENKIQSDYTKIKTVYANRIGTKKAAMPAPKFVSLKINKGTAKVTAKKITFNNTPKTVSYKVSYRIKGNEKWKSAGYKAKNVQTIKGLKKGKVYNFALRYRYQSAVDGKTYVYSKVVYKNAKIK